MAAQRLLARRRGPPAIFVPMKQTLFAVSLALFAACQSAPKKDPAQFDTFGAAIQLDDAVPVSDVLANPENYTGRTVRISGPVDSVCQTKGCWMKVGAESSVFVKFKDYAFFVPKDAAGRDVVFEGELKVTEVSVAEQRHYLEDAGKKDEAAKVTQPKVDVTFLASGVALAKPQAAK